MGTSMEGVEVKVLELFAGTGSVGSFVNTLPNARAWSVDINAETAGHAPTKVADILLLRFAELKFVPDIIWASPPCQTFSIMAGNKHRTIADMTPRTEAAEQGDRILEQTAKIISHFQSINPNLLWYMENPQGRMRHSELLEGLPTHRRVEVSYCKYGFSYQKHTDVWTNDQEWTARTKCSKAAPCDVMVDGKHPAAVRGHPGQEAGPKTLHDRYRIPPELVQEVVLSAHGQVLTHKHSSTLEPETSTAQLTARVSNLEETMRVLSLSRTEQPIEEVVAQADTGLSAEALALRAQLARPTPSADAVFVDRPWTPSKGDKVRITSPAWSAWEDGRRMGASPADSNRSGGGGDQCQGWQRILQV
jgi:hypothetical protein